jgi:hypothetical protein
MLICTFGHGHRHLARVASPHFSPHLVKMSRFYCFPVDYKRGLVPHVPRGFLLFPMGLSPKILLLSFCHITADFGL